jgi:hypothetical protein
MFPMLSECFVLILLNISISKCKFSMMREIKVVEQSFMRVVFSLSVYVYLLLLLFERGTLWSCGII